VQTIKQHLVNGGRVEQNGDVYRLIIPPTPATAYADAQLDDYDHALPRVFANAPPVRITFSARFSHPQIKGTAGFGFWNHPFSRQGDVIAPPRNVWFFYASPESDMRITNAVPGHGFKAAALNSPPVLPSSPGRLTKAINMALNLALRAPGVSGAVMALARAATRAKEAAITCDMTAWHDYELIWQKDFVAFWVDGREILRAPSPPHQPMGFVAWIDNYRATASPSGGYAFA
jgi:hypothetical protein